MPTRAEVKQDDSTETAVTSQALPKPNSLDTECAHTPFACVRDVPKPHTAAQKPAAKCKEKRLCLGRRGGHGTIRVRAAAHPPQNGHANSGLSFRMLRTTGYGQLRHAHAREMHAHHGDSTRLERIPAGDGDCESESPWTPTVASRGDLLLRPMTIGRVLNHMRSATARAPPGSPGDQSQRDRVPTLQAQTRALRRPDVLLPHSSGVLSTTSCWSRCCSTTGSGPSRKPPPVRGSIRWAAETPR